MRGCSACRLPSVVQSHLVQAGPQHTCRRRRSCSKAMAAPPGVMLTALLAVQNAARVLMS